MTLLMCFMFQERVKYDALMCFMFQERVKYDAFDVFHVSGESEI